MSDGRTNTAAWLDGDARAAIIAAAEALYQRGGADAVTLSAVAREVNFARGVIYAHFASRQDLLQLVAPHAAAATLPPEPPIAASLTAETAVAETADAEAPIAAAAPVETSPIETSPVEAPAAETTEAGGKPLEAPVEDKTVESYDELMRAQAEALQSLTQQVLVPKPRQRDAVETALSRLDARMAVAEKSLAALDQRMSERLKSLDVDTGGLAERLHGVRQRLEKFEEKQTLALAQIRLDVHNLAHREATPIRPPQPLPEPEPDVEVLAPVAPDVAADAPIEPVVTVPEENLRVAGYLASARRAANDAAERRARIPDRKKPLWRHFRGRRRWAILAAAAALVAWFDIYVFAHYQPAQGAVGQAAARPLLPSGLKASPEWGPRAQLVRGLRYLNGTGVPADVDKGRAWIERAARSGHPVAENLMGLLYQTGTGVSVDMPVSVGWYEGAARHGNLKAMTNLGKLYAGGWTAGTDFAKAAEWFAKAAAYGDGDAQFDLAILYERGQGIARNIPEAYKWYSIAAKHGDRNAAIRATTLASDLTPEERDAVDAAVASFKPTPVDRAANDAPAVSG